MSIAQAKGASRAAVTPGASCENTASYFVSLKLFSKNAHGCVARAVQLRSCGLNNTQNSRRGAGSEASAILRGWGATDIVV